MRKPSRRRSMTCSDLEEIASSAHGLERFPKCGPLRKEIYADIENLPIAHSAYPTTGTTPLPRRTNHTKSRRGLYFRQVSASRISITKRDHLSIARQIPCFVTYLRIVAAADLIRLDDKPEGCGCRRKDQS